MSLQRAITPALGGPPSDAERTLLDFLRRELPGRFPIASSVTLFLPSGQAHEVDLVILGHYGLYLVEVKGYGGRISGDAQDWTLTAAEARRRVPAPLAEAARKARLMASLLEQEIGAAPPRVEAVVVVAGPNVELDLPPHVRARVLYPWELVHAVQFGDLPGEPVPADREPVGEETAAAIMEILQGIRGRPQPGRGRLREEASLLMRDLALDLRGRSEQADLHGALWLVGCAFVRALEERGLVEGNRLAGKEAVESERAFYAAHPEQGPSDYLRCILDSAAAHPIGAAVLGEVLRRLEPAPLSPLAARAILDFFRQTGQSGRLRWSFTGDPWRDLFDSVSSVQRAADGLLATPWFVDELLLAETLAPALDDLGLDAVRVMDPACGSGLLLLAAFAQLHDRLRAASPDQDPLTAARRALDRIHGADIHPVATLLTRIRLVLSYVELAGIERLAGAAAPPLHIVTADSLLKSGAEDRSNPLEDVLGRRYEVVVCEPPYTTCKDATLRERYRGFYRSAGLKFPLSVPFIERCFDLAAEGGFVGVFAAASFMKRQFGRPLVEEVLAAVDLTRIIDASGAYIPGHGVPNLLLFGRHRLPRKPTVRIVAAKGGEPMLPHDPARGEVWSAIVAHLDDTGYEDDYIAVADVPRASLALHPWSLAAGAGAELKEAIESGSPRRLQDIVTAIRISASSGCDGAFVVPADLPGRLGLEKEVVRPCLSAQSISDWAAVPEHAAITPYGPDGRNLLPEDRSARWWRFLWRYRAVLQARTFAGARISLPWWAWARWPDEPPRGVPRLLCQSVGRMNNFVLDRGEMVSRTSVARIEMSPDASEDDCFALLGYLNSSTACYWLKQTSHQRGVLGQQGSIEGEIFDFNSSVRDIPVPRAVLEPGPSRKELIRLSRQLDRSARERAACAPDRVLARWDRTSGDALIEALAEAQMRELASLRRMVSDQEDLDWLVYEALGLVQDAPVPASGSALPDQRPFAWLSDAPPARLDPRIVEAWSRRRAIARAHPMTRILEDRRYKRPFQALGELPEGTTGEDEAEVEGAGGAAGNIRRVRDFRHRMAKACEAWLLDRIEDVFRGLGDARPLAAGELVSRIEEAAGVREVLSLFHAPAGDADLGRILVAMVEAHAVSYLAAFRHTATGRGKRSQWETTWETQRHEEPGRDARPPAPRTYDQKDYRDIVTWLHRGRLDVPSERFIRYPGAAPDGVTAMYGWAGWDTEQRAFALAAVYEERKSRDRWEPGRLAPLVAGIRELEKESHVENPPWSVAVEVMLHPGGRHDPNLPFDLPMQERRKKNKRNRS